ncbi:MAG: hypothetical protein ABEI96_02420 [Haloarculaceae archaeon]
MSFARKAGVAVVVLLLTTSVASANAVVATHRTVLDPGFVTHTLDDEGAYDVLADGIEQGLVSSVASTGSGAGMGSTLATDIVDRLVTPAYVRTQVRRNVDRFYAYLHGNRGRLELAVTTDRLVEGTPDAVENEFENASLGTLMQSVGGSFGPTSGGASLGASGIDATDLTRMSQNETGYREVRSELRATLRERAVATAANETFRTADDDKLLALVVEDYDPNDHTEAEKARMVDDRETEIKAALRERIRTNRADRINQTVDDRMQSLASGTSRVENPQNVTAAARNVRAVIVTGLATDASYETYRTRLTDAKGDLGRALGERLQTRLDEQLPATMSLSEQLNLGQNPMIDTLKRAVGVLDVLGVALPVLALALIGALWLLTRSLVTVATKTGGALVFAGLPTWVLIAIGKGRVYHAIRAGSGTSPQAFLDVAVGFLDAVLGTLAAQSLVIAVLGIGLYALGAAVRYDYVDPDDLLNRGSTSGSADE